MRAAGLPFPQTMITSSDVTVGKPDPEPYLKGAAGLGLAPDKCIVVEDAPSGVRSGKAAGCRVLAMRTTTYDSELLSEGADWVVNDCTSIHLAAATLRGEVALELADDSRNPRAPRMS